MVGRDSKLDKPAMAPTWLQATNLRFPVSIASYIANEPFHGQTTSKLG